MSAKKNILITGGAGFIGSHVVRLFVTKYPNYNIYNLDKLTYAGNLENITDIENEENYTFIKADIVDQEEINNIFSQYNITDVIHLAAESHVDRSITNPTEFVMTNVIGTTNLLNAAIKHWGRENADKRFYHVSTDEVYGSLGESGFFTEDTPYDPQSPYSASKAASDHLVRAYVNTYKLNAVISNCSNNYGPNQFPEKLIPLVINNIKHNKPLPIYGKGDNIRDWLFVIDHARAIDVVFHKGIVGETYNIGGHNEWTNLNIVKTICDIMDELHNQPIGTAQNLITFVKDRAGHDHRYAIDASKIEKELGWTPSLQFEKGIKETIQWYLSNENWLKKITSGEYQNYYSNMYE